MAMTELTNTIRRLRAPLMAAGALLALSGCAATHVGEDWQCPLDQGSQCASVAAADPAVKDASALDRSARPAPLYRAQDANAPAEDGKTVVDCDRGCDPFAWIGRLFAGGASGNEDDADEVAGKERHAREAAARVESADAREAQPNAAAVDTSGNHLRAPETIGRIWIAPHVDADGVYREGSYVRIVIAPADWKPDFRNSARVSANVTIFRPGKWRISGLCFSRTACSADLPP